MSFSESAGGIVPGRPGAVTGTVALPPRAYLLLAAAIFLACLVPAAINGFPVVFPDTEGYIVAADVFRPQFARAFGYGAFIGMTGGLLSLWLTIIAQAALTAWLVARTVAAESSRWPEAWRLPMSLAVLAVVLLSHLPWLASWVQPDLLTGLMLLSLFLLAEHRERLSRLEQILLFSLLVGCVTVHLSHPPLLAGLGVFSLGVLAVVLLWRGSPELVARVRRTAVLALLAAALGWGALGTANYITYRSFTGSLGGSVFLFARLAADGDTKAALRPECEAGRPWAACRHLDRMNLTTDEFLWRNWSPLVDMGYAYKFMREAGEINPILLQKVWPEWLAKSAGRMLRQVVRFELGNGMDDEGTWIMSDPLVDIGQAKVIDAVAGTLQATDDLRSWMPRVPVETLAGVGLVALVGFVVFGLVRGRPDLWWPALMLLTAYLGNAALVSLGSDVFGRYAGRLVWLAPLLAGLLALRAAGAEQDRSYRSRAMVHIGTT